MMRHCDWRMTVIGAVLLGVCGVMYGDGFPVVTDGEAQAVVVVPEDSYPIAAYAAEELIWHVEQATGVALPMTTESETPASPSRRIYVGATEAAAGAGIDVEALAPAAFVVQQTDQALFISAADGPGDPLRQNHDHSGVLWGVYDFLDRELGVRWLWPGELGTYVPRTDMLVVQPEDRTIAPRFQWQRLRGGFRDNNPAIGFTEEGLAAYRDAQDVFLRRHRMDQSRRPGFGHVFGGWWEQYGEDHPEWFQEREDGKRGPRVGQRTDRVSMCVSNPGLHDKVFALWQERLEASPDRTPTMSLPEADSRGRCLCEVCKSWDAPQPSEETLAAMTSSMRGTYNPRNASDRYLRFWKIMHDRAVAVAPDVVTTAYVYFNYFVAPAAPVELPAAMHLDFVPWGGFWFPRPIQEQEWVKEQWLGWQATGASMSYRPNYFHDGYVMPHLFTRQFADMFQFVEQNGAVATDFDSLKGQWATQGPMLYLLARLHTRPRATVETLLTEYYEAFGPAADHVRAYFEFWETHTTVNSLDGGDTFSRYGASRLHRYARAAHALFPPESFARADAILADAEEAVADADEAYGARVDFLRCGFEHARMAAELAALFADGTVSADERRAAFDALAAFRHENEGLFFSNLTHASHVETRSWGDESGFPGE